MTKKPSAKPKRKRVLKRYDFGFQGKALGGSAIVLAYTLEEARRLVRSDSGYTGGFWVEKRSEFLARPQVINFDDGDY